MNHYKIMNARNSVLKVYVLILETLLLLPYNVTEAKNFDDYQKNRKSIINQESQHSIGAKIKLTKEEAIVNDILMNLKYTEFNESFNNPRNFKFSKHYFTYKDYIETSKVYQFIKRMPKGAALHLHSTYILDGEYLLKLTYEDDLYACYEGDKLLFRFAYGDPQIPCAVKWRLMKDLRSASGDIAAFDAMVKSHLTLESDDPKDMEADSTAMWTKFNKIRPVIRSLVHFRPVQEKCLYEVLKRLYDDNIMYAELRHGIRELYELDGTVHDDIHTMKLFRDVTDKFIEDYPDFIGVKYIMTKARSVSIALMQETLIKAKRLKKEFPLMFAGFDLTGQEDAGRPLMDFLPLLLEARGNLDYYFHAGETNWFGTPADTNLVDAILLGTKRIGHGYALTKHPVLMSMVKKRNIAVEVNVISNAVLALIKDVRNHPLAVFISLGLPVVLSSDEPGAWGAAPLSHDFYVAFIAVASKHSDLRLLKQLALNSITFNSLEIKRKTKLLDVFNNRWNDFLTSVIAEYS